MDTDRSVTQLITIGASAGGVESLAILVSTLPTPFPAPIVIAQHLDPNRPSHLQEILARRSNLPVHSVVGIEPLEAGVIFVVPSNRHVTISDHHVGIDPEGAGRPKPSIDLLFDSAASVFGEGMIAVVLSGLGSDGAAGACRVKEAGGTVVIQNPRTAPYPAMPQALAPTIVDVIADVDSMGPLLNDLLIGTYTPNGPRDDRQIRTFLEELRDRSGIDFSQYKMPTIQRRLQRRLVATGTHSLEEYRAYLADHIEECDRLINAFLIKVTGFFRDRDLFVYLREQVLPELIERGRANGNELRFWSAGCATGEEAYSLALLVADALGADLEAWTVRIFATDLDAEAVDFARRGKYPAAALDDLPPDLLARYFTEDKDAYMVSKAVRALLVFGEHDLGQRPPFPRIDLCLCRNVLIYFTPELQRRALETFAFGLREGGVLVLGSAETTSPLPNLFTPMHMGLRVYRGHGDRPRLFSPIESTRRSRSGHTHLRPRAGEELARVRREVREAQVDQIMTEELLLRLPVGIVVVDRKYDILRLNSEARRLLGIHMVAVGEDLVHLAERIPAAALRAAIDAAIGGEERTVEAVPTDALIPGETRWLRIGCRPYRGGGDAAPESAVLMVTDVTDAERERAEVARLRAALEQAGAANRMLLDANQELTTVNALLRHSNEDFLLNNEEIQAATEEVETL
ncbi:MAG: CheR family methyltransferase, partial [Chloroflexota bacterium]